MTPPSHDVPGCSPTSIHCFCLTQPFIRLVLGLCRRWADPNEKPKPGKIPFFQPHMYPGYRKGAHGLPSLSLYQAGVLTSCARRVTTVSYRLCCNASLLQNSLFMLESCAWSLFQVSKRPHHRANKTGFLHGTYICLPKAHRPDEKH